MSNSTTPLADDAAFPQGQCRYILTVPDIKGHRCGCVAFSQNKSVPGAICACGHLPCFHLARSGTTSSGQNKDEIDELKRRVHSLEAQQQPLEHEHTQRPDFHANVLERVGTLEEALEKNREEAQAEVRGFYGHISGAWRLIEQLQQQAAGADDLNRALNRNLERTETEARDLHTRYFELFEANESLEKRVKALEKSNGTLSPVRTSRSETAAEPCRSVRHPPGDIRPRRALSPSGSWTVHISLLPTKDQPLPFEKDTVAYQRCLSRGMLRMVAVQGSDASSFVAAVNRDFSAVLRGRAWTPLQARLCDADALNGVPMIRPLEAGLTRTEFDADFLRDHCAICDPNGRMEALYIAPQDGNISWRSIQDSPVYVEGLETSWEYESLLDHPESGLAMDTPGRPPKRAASDMSHAQDSHAPVTEEEGDYMRSKVRRIRNPELLEIPSKVKAAS